MVISSLLNIAHAACRDLLRVLRFVFWMSHDIFISRDSLSLVAMCLLFYSLREKPTSAKKCVSATDSDKQKDCGEKEQGFVQENTTPTDQDSNVLGVEILLCKFTNGARAGVLTLAFVEQADTFAVREQNLLNIFGRIKILIMAEFLAYFITREEYLEQLKTRVPYKPTFAPHFKISVRKDFDMYSFTCAVFHNDGSGFFRILGENDTRTMTPFIDYFTKGKKFYITSNGVSFYIVLDVHLGEQKLIEMSVKLIIDNKYVETNHAFMIMPFREKTLNTFYKDHIKTYLSEHTGISIYRADDFNDNEVIIDTIYREIEKSEFIICEISYCNKNVFFEIGYAKALGKELIFLLQRGFDHEFFDVAHIRRIDYDLDNPVEMQSKLADTIKNIRGKR